MKNAIIVVLFVVGIAGCSIDDQELDGVREHLSSIEANLSLADGETLSEVERIQRIDSMIGENIRIRKRPFLYFLEDTVSINSSFHCEMGLASHNRKSPPFAILNVDGRVDTAHYNPSCDCIPFSISNVKLGENDIEGKIFEDGRTYEFGAWFIGKK
ncbi:hypothetical protein [Owenweeksia hongkongensis]|uniref:hypothetical protein n=1 Tax=Owenweeksia hongkongensis TaxID=253245 RepID=UPI003A8F135A